MTKEWFITFIQDQVVGSCSYVVVLNNCSIHHDKEVWQIVEDKCGAMLVYLPPYSPDFNPIEQA
ncbi:hypothetical protein PAXRUDRAFT_776090, partial [Paxillus rubicundulus Ve08.2h10]